MLTLHRWLDPHNPDNRRGIGPVFRAALLSCVPSLCLGLGIAALLAWAGVDLEALIFRKHELNASFVWSGLLGAPILETLLMAWAISLLKSTGKSNLNTAVWVGIGAGLMHAFNSPLAIVPTAWAFFIFALTYLAWRHRSHGHAFFASAAVHALDNLGVIVFARTFS